MWFFNTHALILKSVIKFVFTNPLFSGVATLKRRPRITVSQVLPLTSCSQRLPACEQLKRVCNLLSRVRVVVNPAEGGSDKCHVQEYYSECASDARNGNPAFTHALTFAFFVCFLKDPDLDFPISGEAGLPDA